MNGFFLNHLIRLNIENNLRALLLLCIIHLHSQNIDILVRWDLNEGYQKNWPMIREQGDNVRVFNLGFGEENQKVLKYFENNYSSDTKKIIVMEDFIDRSILSSIPKSEIVLFMWEPIGESEDTDYYSYVYTFNDDLVGIKNHRKFNYPHLMPLIANPVPFENKKLCTAVISHWLPEREEVIGFFRDHHLDAFDLYGGRAGPFEGSLIYKGRIEGHHSASPKLQVLRNYKFVLTFENSACPRYHISSGYIAPGYITEKIFGVFAAGSVPVYLGPENIEDYIPKNCFINYRDFHSPQELYNYLTQMPKETYNEYLKNIQEYLSSPRALVFSPEAFEKTILEAAGS